MGTQRRKTSKPKKSSGPRRSVRPQISLPSHKEHKEQAPARVGCMVITCSDTRTSETDTSGWLIRKELEGAGHEVVAYHLVKDEPKLITALIQQAARNKRIQAVLINGGTGISRRDSTFEAVDALLEKRLVGFGEIFRYLTYQDIGSAAIMSRATAGLYKNRIVISTPGSEGAVRLAMEKLVLPELGHMLREATK
ncbi:MAG: MogA/MoaB family molybdenum cofactor biosynthesis protein [Nitrospirota bacterium]|nr:MogA/MoaB family molybdenum cofactor biosynthesis protein [Nitrospirota bacterium]MDE3034675.1 MogA/MoaB family molybdenum cofactor biosynthesis protein [Nitrospirota bacterium]MDE3118384.1 MogA/MoaB family molybdenum cofactor biosynthesis protein [Nitrospirota bacterium]MDE3242772.1 MogA/MoaB family molybdenum cofactor biosynthesis protein [Nitrospirota bacterium]